MKLTKGEKTRQQIIERTAEFFNKRGVLGTSLADIMASTGLSKGAIYGAFKDKDEIAVAVFKTSAKRMKAQVIENLDHSSQRNKVLSLLDFFLTNTFTPPVPGGCPLFNAAVEADDNNGVMRDIIAHELLSTVQLIETAIAKGKESGEFPKDVNQGEIAFSLFCALEGALVMSRVSASVEPMKNVVDFWKKTIHNLK